MRRGFQVSDISSVECEVLIVCSTYNQEKYLADALEGFVSQKASFPFLALVHDDASTDGTADVIREYETRYPDIIKGIYEDENQYQQGALFWYLDYLRNSKAKYIALCEGDDGSDQISELLSEKKLVVDVSSLVGLLSGDLQLASKFELLVHQLPFGTLFIGDDKTVNEGAYQLRTMFDDIIECDIEIDKDAQKDKRVKRTLVSLDELEFKQVLTTLESELIGQIEFKRSFESRSRSFRLFNALDEQPVFSLLLLGPSGVGKTEVAKILCEAIAPCQPLPKVNLGNYSSKDSLNSLIGSPRGYMGSEEGELGKKIDSSDAGILLVDEFEKAEPAVWNFFLDLLETGSFTDSQGMEHDLRGFIIVFTTNCPLGKINETFPAELLSRFNLMSHFSKLSVSDKKFFVERYVSMFAKKYRETAPSGLPTLPDDIAGRAMMEIDIEATENIRILKNTTRSWISEFVEKARKSSSIATQPSIINAQT